MLLNAVENQESENTHTPENFPFLRWLTHNAIIETCIVCIIVRI